MFKQRKYLKVNFKCTLQLRAYGQISAIYCKGKSSNKVSVKNRYERVPWKYTILLLSYSYILYDCCFGIVVSEQQLNII